MIATNTRLFEDIVSAWDEPLCCQTQQSRRPCRNQARWIAVDSHFTNCFGRPHTVLLCTFHKTRWLQRAWEKIASWGYFQCTHCGQRFTTPTQSVTFRRV